MTDMQLMSVPEIRAWLKSIIRRKEAGKPNPHREGATLDMVSKYLDIPKNSLKWLANKDTANVGPDRQRALSKFISEYENGLIDFKISNKEPGVQISDRYKKIGHRCKVLVRNEKPKVRQKYQVSFGPKGLSLQAKDRPRPPGKMPSFKDLLGG